MKAHFRKEKQCYMASILVGRLWCFLYLQVSKPQIIQLFKKKKKNNNNNNNNKWGLPTCRVEKELYGLQFTLWLAKESWCDSLWKSFGLPCGTVKNRKGDQPLEKGILSGKREKKKGLYYLFMHAWAIESSSISNLSRLHVQTWKNFE